MSQRLSLRSTTSSTLNGFRKNRISGILTCCNLSQLLSITIKNALE